MATYEYRCGTDGLFEVSVAMGTASASVGCPVCGGVGGGGFCAPRWSLGRGAWVGGLGFCAPGLWLGLGDLGGGINDAAATSERPPVVSSIPAGGARRRTPM